MGSFNNVLLLGTLLFFFFTFSSSDDNLINSLCSKTEEPVICKECLKADPKGSSADGQGLALIALGCAERDTTQLEDNISNLLENATGKLKGILQECSAQAFRAQQDFEPIEGYVQQGYYKSARDVITGEIIPFVASCLEGFNKAPEVPVPSLVLAGSVAANDTSKIAAAILSNI